MSTFSCSIVVILLVILGDEFNCQIVSPPKGVKFSSIKSQSVTVQWNATLDHAVNAYRVFYKRKDDVISWSTKTVGKATTEVQIEKLKPFTDYVVQVLVNTSSGISNRSDVVEVQTAEDFPNPPSGLQAAFNSSSNLKISWSLLSSDQANGIVHGYDCIVYKAQGNAVVANKTVSNTINSVNVEIPSLEVCSDYVIQVRARTGAGNGNYSRFNFSNSCESPKIVYFKEQVLATLYSYFAVLPCNYSGFPKPSISWILNSGYTLESGYQIQDTVTILGGTQTLKKTRTVFENGSLVISFVENTDKGLYTCVVKENKFDSVSANTTLIVGKGTLTAIFQLSLANQKYDNDLKDKESNRYKDLSSKIVMAVRKIYNNTENYIIQNIRIVLFSPGSVIALFTVSATFDSAPNKQAVLADIVDIMVTNTEDGKLGSFSVGNFTVHGAPPPPIDLSVVRLRSTYVILEWKPPKNDAVYEIDKYSMQYRKHGSRDKKFKSVKTVKNNGAVISGNLDGLEGGERYVVRIMSHRKTRDDSQDSQGVTIEIETPKDTLLQTILLAVILPIVLPSLIVVFICILRKHFRKPTEEENPLPVRFSRPGGPSTEENPYDLGRLLEEFPCRWKEIPRSDLTVGKELGAGAFGCVVKAELRVNDKTIPCAVKTLKDFATEHERRDLFNELSIMAQVGYHPNVISLIGASTVNGPLWLVVKLAENGSLIEYLHRHRKLDYVDHSYVNTSGSNNNAIEIEELDKLQKLKFAYGIAKGMSHLEKLKCVHRDLAARNVLLGKHLVTMVSDFGLSRDIYESGMYEDVRGGKRPVRWMAPESIEDYTCTTKSDVWSFGVTLWEIETAGTVPYAGVDGGMDILNEVKKGYRLEKPKTCDDDVYDVMSATWRPNPLNRPTFEELTGIIEELLTGISDYLEIQPDDEYQDVFTSAYDEVHINTADLEDLVVDLPNSLNLNAGQSAEIHF